MAEFYIQGKQAYHGAGVQGAAIGTGVVASEFARCYFENLPAKVRPELAPLDVAEKLEGHSTYLKGRSHIDGPVKGPLYPDELYHSSAWAMAIDGSNSVSGSAGVGFTHTLAETSDQDDKPAYGATLENFIGGNTNALLKDHVGCFLNSFAISGSQGGPVEYEAAWLGKSESLAGTLSTPSFTNCNPFEFAMLGLYYGASLGATLTSVDTPTRFRWSRNNNITLHYGASVTPIAASWGTPEIMLEFDFTLKNNATIYNIWNNDTEYAWVVILTHTELAGTSSGYYSIRVNMPRMRMEGDPPNLSGNAEQTMTVKLRALVEQTNYNYAMRAIIVNSVSGAYTT